MLLREPGARVRGRHGWEGDVPQPPACISTAGAHATICVSPWELRTGAQKYSLSPNISLYIWASVTFSIPLAIFYLALQHYSSGQAIVTTVIFPQAACCRLLLTTTLSQRNSQLIQEVPWIRKQTRKTEEIAVQYLRRLTPKDELFYVRWVYPSNSFPLFGAHMVNTFHCTHCTHGGRVQFQPHCKVWGGSLLILVGLMFFALLGVGMVRQYNG